MSTSQHPLVEYARQQGVPVNRLIDAAQLAGIISDNCIGVETVPTEAQRAAVKWLETHGKESR